MGDVQPLLDLVKQAGGPLALAAVFYYLWRQEREERLKAQERERDLTRELLKQIETTVKSINAIRSLRNFFLHGRVPRAEEYEAEDVE